MSRPKIYKVPTSRMIRIGNLDMGADSPVVLQSMTSTDTNDIAASTAQFERIMEAGGEMIRFTTQGKKEVKSLEKIIQELQPATKCVPVVADIHFNPEAAELAATICQKIRINPGNYTERSTALQEFSEADFDEGATLNKSALLSLLEICKTHQTALRIGVNHGSLSKRIMSKYGDTPAGMVESAMEFLRICREASFNHVAVSLKSSNTRVMVQSVRLLVKEMIREGLYFPVHLGVTEAGDGDEGRIKSVVGMAPLLMEGIGDTIRVSLTEPPEDEIPVAENIRQLFPKPKHLPYDPFSGFPWDPFHYRKSATKRVCGVGGGIPPVVWGDSSISEYPSKFTDEYFFTDTDSDPSLLNNTEGDKVIVLDITGENIPHVKNWLARHYSVAEANPVVIRTSYSEKDRARFALKAAGELGALLIDGLVDGVWIENNHFDREFLTRLSFQILQASRARITTTEFIACPSCGRTLFDIQSVLSRVKKKTGHLSGLKIAVMGCIVNGPGEMADADYGYVGTGKGNVSLYKAGTVAQKNIPEASAIDELVKLIRKHGDWVDS